MVLEYSVGASKLTPVIIDFSKSCFLSQGKKYALKNKQIASYKEKHPEIAPDLEKDIVNNQLLLMFTFLQNFYFNIIFKECSGVGTSLQTTIVHESLSFHAAEHQKLIDIEKAFK